MLELLEKRDTSFPAEIHPEAGLKRPTVAVVGLGYVGLPVAVAFGKLGPTIGYDLSRKKIESLKHRVDMTGEVTTADLTEARHLRFMQDAAEIEQADIVIVAVPTPVNAAHQPDLSPLESASCTVGKYLKPGS